jgi:hypothetical protein
MPTKKWEATHLFVDPGEPIAAPDFRPRTVRKNPEEAWAKAFAAAGKTYGQPITSGDAIDELARRLVAK